MQKETHKQELSTWMLMMLFLSICAVINIFVEFTFNLHPEKRKALMIIDNIICIFFLVDFFYTLFTVKSKKNYLKWGWIDFISSIPFFNFTRFGRIILIIRILRILFQFKNYRNFIFFIFKNKLRGIFLIVISSTFIIAVMSALIVLHYEQDLAISNIKNAKDALWWSFVTITTVGYGDYVPITDEGRVMSIILMTTGVTLLSSLTAYLGSLFFQEYDPVKENMYAKHERKVIMKKLEALSNKLDSIEKKINDNKT